ncbi:MAG: hypothetical protein H0X70_10145 [Segetibacter sp.]|jgi:hypothetical protein|nr:hypothetical protein [Segetibacter sp.]
MKKLFGSTTSALMHHAPIPLIIVPESAGFKIPKAIALASDVNENSIVSILKPVEELEKF